MVLKIFIDLTTKGAKAYYALMPEGLYLHEEAGIHSEDKLLISRDR